MISAPFEAADRRRLEERGLSIDEARRQLELLRRPGIYAEVDRACTVGDGILRIAEDEVSELHGLHREAARAGRFAKFVPASGAASRMFRELLQGDSRTVSTLIDNLPSFAFHNRLAGSRDVVDALLGPDGLDYANAPKGLIEFHAYPDGPRTPLEEQLVEAAQYVRDAQGACRIHFTVSPEHAEAFSAHLREVRPRYEQHLGVSFAVDFSEQDPSTDTLAIDPFGMPLRDEHDRLVLRPGGHGALIGNLGALGGDLLYVKNIDNVQPDRLKPLATTWKRTLGGFLVKTQRAVFDFVRALRTADPPEKLIEEATRFVEERLNVTRDGKTLPATYQCQRAFLIERLNRPLRVCGVVPNTGEPGGGPFWVRGRDGVVTPQIVEKAQIDPDDAARQAALRASTHFNPVDLVCGLRDLDGRPYDLTRYVDPEAAIVSRKSADGRDLKALERPGLWNGAMAGWNTIFVEVPIETFSPVKSVLDLLRPEHQA